MASRMDEFRSFVMKYPKLKDEVNNGKRTWQSIYEEWVLYGDKTDWSKYQDNEIKQNVNDNKKPGSVTLSVDTIKNIAGYLKKINPDDLNKTLNTVQKVIQIVQTVGGNKTGNINLGSSVYNDWWD